MGDHIPQTIRVGSIDYSVELTSGLSVSDDLLGAIHYGVSKIRLEESLPPTKLVDTFVHELAHALFYEAGFEDHEEDTVNRIAKVLTMVLRDNDFTFMRETEEKSK